MAGGKKPSQNVVVGEQAGEKGGVPQQRVERRDERDGGGRLGRSLQQRGLLGQDEALAADALDVDGHQRAELDQLLPQLVAPLRRGDASERTARAAGAEQAVGAVAGQELVAELLSLRDLVREHLRREQPFEEVVVPEVAVAPSEADHARDGAGLEHGAHGVLRHPEPVLRRAGFPLEVAGGQRSFRADPFEHALGHRGVLGEGRAVESGPLAAHGLPEPREFARRDERQRLVGRLEDLTAFIQRVAPGGLVGGDARVQHEVVVPAGDRDRVELDRPELAEDLHHGFEASRDRPRRREEVPRYQKAPSRLGSYLHLGDTSRAGQARPQATACVRQVPRRRR